MSLVAGRDGGLQNMEVLGMIMLRVTEPDMARIRIAMDNREDRAVQFQVRRSGSCIYCIPAKYLAPFFGTLSLD